METSIGEEGSGGRLGFVPPIDTWAIGYLAVLVTAAACQLGPEPEAPELELGVSPVKQLDFRWTAVEGAERYRLLESAAPGEPFVRAGHETEGESLSITRPLHLRAGASYVLGACNAAGCADSEPVSLTAESLTEAIGYFKASNTHENHYFGSSVALSGDGSTLAVGAFGDDSSAYGIDGDQTDDSYEQLGAVFVFVRDAMGQWSQQAYLETASPDPGDQVGGFGLALSDDGNTLAVGVPHEDSRATGVDGNQADNFLRSSGAVYVFVRDRTHGWSQQAYVKASNTDSDDYFGHCLALSGDGDTLAVAAPGERSRATGIDGDQLDDSAGQAGAVYVFAREADHWSQQAYVKASNTGVDDMFGGGVALSGDGHVLAVGAPGEDGNATGIGGDQSDESAPDAGAAYVFVRDAADRWSQQAYVKASNTDAGDYFGGNVALSDRGDTLVVIAGGEDSSATGIDGDQADDSAPATGAAYVFVRQGADRWSQQAYVKASNSVSEEAFGAAIGFSGDGNVLAIGTPGEGSNATGIDGDQTYDAEYWSGAVYVIVRGDTGQWAQRAYVKASNTRAGSEFGDAVALSRDGNTLAVGARLEYGGSTGIGGDQADGSTENAGAVYLY